LARLENKVVLISGGASGIGAATAQLVLREGGKAVLADRDETKGRALAGELGYNTPLGDCQAASGVTTKTGMDTSVLNALNTRFDIYANGNNTCPSQYGGACGPSTNTRKDVVCKPNNTGTRILCVSGDVVRPGYYEIEVGALTMGQVINEMAGGPKPGRKIKAVIPGGSSAKILRAGDLFKLKDREVSLEEIPMDFDSLAAVGSMAGSGGVIVMDDSRDMVWALNNINEFYAHESCGQCTPCREGSLWMKKVTDRMLSGGGVTQDPATLKTPEDIAPLFVELAAAECQRQGDVINADTWLAERKKT